MRAKVRVPYMVKAGAVGWTGHVFIVASKDHHFDVPELDERDAPIVMPPLELPESDIDAVAAVVGECGPSISALRMIDGKLYRRFASVRGESEVLDLDRDVGPDVGPLKADSPFEAAWRMPTRDFVHLDDRWKADPGRYQSTSNLVVSPISSIYRNRGIAIGIDVKSKFTRSIPHFDNYLGEEAALAQEFEHAVKAFGWIDSDDVVEAEQMRDRQCARLVVIGDDLWYETRPPAIRVESRFDQHYPSLSTVRVRYDFLQDIVDQDITAVYFPLDQMDAAVEEAERLRALYKIAHMSRPESLPQFEPSDAFDFDVGDEHVRRGGNALAMTLCRTTLQHPEKVPEELSAAMERIRTSFLSENAVLGRVPDYASMMEDIRRIWMEGRVTAKWGGLSNLQTPQIRRAIEQIDHIAEHHSAVKVRPFMASRPFGIA